jgi:hypothetical protein
MHEYTLVSFSNFGVDHFRPKSKAKRLKCVYQNLYYCCNECNRNKRDTWPNDTEKARGYRFADACSEVIYGKHLKCHFDGTLEWLTPVGEYTDERIILYREDLRRLREDRNKALKMIREFRNISRRSVPLTLELADLHKRALEFFIRLYLDPPPAHPSRRALRRKRAKSRK